MEVTDLYIENILNEFAIDIKNYEIINLKEMQGWSTSYLYLITSSLGDYIFKVKTEEQFKGYSEEVIISDFLHSQGKVVRKSILTKTGETYVKKDDCYWCLLSFVPGAAAHVDEYTEKTVADLAQELSGYIMLSMNRAEVLEKLKLPFSEPKNPQLVFERVLAEKRFLSEVITSDISRFEEWYKVGCLGCHKIIDDYKNVSIIHNDINPKNILFDHTSKDIICFIDWDHGCFGSPLKDVFDTISMFYDYLDNTKARRFSKLFLENINSEILNGITDTDFGRLFQYFYTYAKWKSVLFYADLLKKYNNQYGERDRYIFEINSLVDKWLNMS